LGCRMFIGAEIPLTDQAIWPLRWDVTGPEGALFPVLDADIRLTPAGEDATLLAVSAVCRLPPGGLAANLDEVVRRRVAQETIQTFTNHIGIAVMCPAARNPRHSEGASRPRTEVAVRGRISTPR